MEKLNILVLHRLGNPQAVPFFLQRHVFALRNSLPAHNYLYHDTTLPLPGYVRDTRFDAIILDVTFLCVRWLPAPVFAAIREEYAFVKHCEAVKIAFPQDEYDCNELLDDWLCDWALDVVYSVIASHWDILYPNFHRRGSIVLGYTGYVDESLLSRKKKSFADRTIDIGYRARKLPPYFGRIGETKWTIGRDVELHGRERGLKTDIVLGERGTLYGGAWLDFIDNCKFTLGANSGSSMLDPRGDIQRGVRTYLKRNPTASFDEVESNCFSGLDGQYSFTAISPRVLEAALLGSCQILVEGEYSGVIRPWEHYIPIRSDASDFPEVFRAIRDESLVDRLTRNCRDAILDNEHFRHGHAARKLTNAIASLKAKKRVISSSEAVARVVHQYDRDMEAKYSDHWRRQALRRKLVDLIDRSPMISRLTRSIFSMVRG